MAHKKGIVKHQCIEARTHIFFKQSKTKKFLGVSVGEKNYRKKRGSEIELWMYARYASGDWSLNSLLCASLKLFCLLRISQVINIRRHWRVFVILAVFNHTHQLFFLLFLLPFLLLFFVCWWWKKNLWWFVFCDENTMKFRTWKKNLRSIAFLALFERYSYG